MSSVLRRRRCPAAGAAAALAFAAGLAGCGGGGGADTVIEPFQTQAALVVADLDADGRPDVAVVTTWVDGPPPHAGAVAVYRADAARGFQAPVSTSAGPDPWGMAVGDLDGDGRPDLVVATPQVGVASDSGGVSVLRQDPAHPGRFLAPQWIATGGMAQDVAILDVDGDGRPDLVVADAVAANGRALVLLQDRSAPGQFLAPVALAAGHALLSLAAADVDGDGRVDLVAAADDGVRVFYAGAGGGLEPPVFLPGSGLHTRGVAVRDLDGDGRPDIVAVHAGRAPDGGTGGAGVTVWRQTASRTFAASVTPVPDGARQAAIGDLDGDGRPDIAVVSLVEQALTTPSRVSVLRPAADGSGRYEVALVVDGTPSGRFIAVADVNGDGRQDIVLDDGPGVLLQRADAPGAFEALRTLR